MNALIDEHGNVNLEEIKNKTDAIKTEQRQAMREREIKSSISALNSTLREDTSYFRINHLINFVNNLDDSYARNLDDCAESEYIMSTEEEYQNIREYLLLFNDAHWDDISEELEVELLQLVTKLSRTKVLAFDANAKQFYMVGDPTPTELREEKRIAALNASNQHQVTTIPDIYHPWYLRIYRKLFKWSNKL